ncbi:hypothetical protein MRX96_005334 [Rhipicephalus microplus]
MRHRFHAPFFDEPIRRAAAQKRDQCSTCHEDNRLSKVTEPAEARIPVEAPEEPRTPARNPAVRTTRKRESAPARRLGTARGG